MTMQHATLPLDLLDAVIFGTDCIVYHRAGTGIYAPESAIGLLRELRRRGARTATVSAHRRDDHLLRMAEVRDLFDATVDGVDAARKGFDAWPDPDLLLETTRRLGVSPRRTAIIESTVEEVEAAWRGGFSVVLAIDPDGRHHREFGRHGARLIVRDLAAIRLKGTHNQPCFAHE